MKSRRELLNMPGWTVVHQGEDGMALRCGALRVICSWGFAWDHVSVSLSHRCPTWEEMERVKRAFFKESETAMQLHVPPAEHINCHPYCLHLWRPRDRDIPLPPAWLVGPLSARMQDTGEGDADATT